MNRDSSFVLLTKKLRRSSFPNLMFWEFKCQKVKQNLSIIRKEELDVEMKYFDAGYAVETSKGSSDSQNLWGFFFIKKIDTTSLNKIFEKFGSFPLRVFLI